MSEKTWGAGDYPVAERHPEAVKGSRGRSLQDLTLEAVAAGDVTMVDLTTTPEALLRQAAIARDVGREALAENFERAAEMNRLSNDEVMRIYELLRPGRAASKEVLLAAARHLREDVQAPRLAAFLEEAAEVYEKRGLFSSRF
jgi:propanediol dehydratase small subunit